AASGPGYHDEIVMKMLWGVAHATRRYRWGARCRSGPTALVADAGLVEVQEGPVDRGGRGRQGQGRGVAGAEPLDHVRGEAPPRAGRRVRRSGDHPGVGHQQHREVLDDEVLAKLARRLGPLHELGEAAEGAIALGFKALVQR